MALALGLPLGAVQPVCAADEPVPASASAVLSQRSAAMAALSLLPQDCALYGVLPNAGSNLQNLLAKMNANAGPGRLFALPPEALKLNSVAFAIAGEGTPTLAVLMPLVYSASASDNVETVLRTWQEAAEEAQAAVIGEAEEAHRQAVSDGAMQKLATDAHVAPVYAVLSFAPGEEKTAESLSLMLTAFMLNSMPEGGEIVEKDGFRGVRVPYELPAEDGKEVTRWCHILSKAQGANFILVVCEDPAEIRLAESPETSLLASAQLAPCDAHAAESVFSGGASAAMSDVWFNSSRSLHTSAAETFGNIFRTLAEKDPASAPLYNKAADGVGVLVQQLCRPQKPAAVPSVVTAWMDGKQLKIEHRTDARGYGFEPGELRFSALAQAPTTLLTLESTPTSGTARADFAAVGNAVQDIIGGVIPTLRPEAEEEMQKVQKFVGPLGTLLTAAGTLADEALDGSLAMLVDAGGKLPPAWGGSPEKEGPFPRAAIRAGVKDRAKLTESWNSMVSAYSAMMEMSGKGADVASTLNVTAAQDGDTSTYSLTFPDITPDTTPTLTVGNAACFAGTSPAFVAGIAATAGETKPFSGVEFSLNIVGWAECLRHAADSMQAQLPVEEEATPMAEHGVTVPDDDDDEDEDDDWEEDCDWCHTALCNEMSREEKRAHDAEQMASAVEQLAETVTRIYGTVTEEQGQMVTNVTLYLK